MIKVIEKSTQNDMIRATKEGSVVLAWNPKYIDIIAQGEEVVIPSYDSKSFDIESAKNHMIREAEDFNQQSFNRYTVIDELWIVSTEVEINSKKRIGLIACPSSSMNILGKEYRLALASG